MNERLKILLDQDYIGRNFKPEYRLLRKYATYYLLPKGIDVLKQAPDTRLDATVLRNIRNDKNRSDQFVEGCLGLFNAYCQFKAALGNDLYFSTKSQLVNRYDYFADFMPSAYMRVERSGEEKDYFIEYLQTSKPFFTTTQRLKDFIKYSEAGDWEAETNSDFPKTLFICDKPALQNRLLKRAAYLLEDVGDDVKFFAAVEGNINNWHDLSNSDETLSLSQT
jgi:hypothetical protein